jgi:hypothetical protein
MNVLYTSPLGGIFERKVPSEAVATYVMRDAAVMALQAYGGINAPNIEEVRALRKVILTCKRKIQRNSWYSTRVQPKKEAA